MNNYHFEDPFLKILPTIDVHGETGDTVIYPLECHIKENKYLGKYKIAVIHGRHGGVLKKSIHAYLRKHKSVERYYIYPGNDGITIIELK